MKVRDASNFVAIIQKKLQNIFYSYEFGYNFDLSDARKYNVLSYAIISVYILSSVIRVHFADERRRIDTAIKPRKLDD